MALKKPSDFFGESKKESIIENLVQKPELTSFSDAVNLYKENISKFEDLSETLKSIESIQSDIKDFIKKEDLDNAVGSYAFLLEETVAKLKNDVTGINEKNLISMRSNISNLTEKINNFFKIEVPKYKKNIVEIEIKSSDKFEKYKNDTDIILEDISKYVSDKYESISENKDNILDIEKSISKQQKDIEEKYKSINGANKDTILEIKKSISKHQIDIEQRTEKNIDSVNETVDRVVEDLEKKISLISDNKDTIFQDLSKKITEVKNLKKSVNKDLKVYEDHKNNVENKISDLEIEVIRSKSNLKNQNEEFIKVKKDIGNDFNTIHEEFKTVVNRLNLDELEEKNIQLSKKVKYLEEVFEKFNEKEFLNEGIVNITPKTDNSDPLTPLDKNYVTLNQLQDHYRLFLNRIQQQLSTLGGGGAVNIKDMDDVDSSAFVNGKVLEYDSTLKKWKGGTGGGGSSDVVDDTTPQLGGNLDINDKYITGTGGVNVTGVVTSTKSHVGLDTGFFNEDLVVTGDARVTGILTIGTGSITLDPNAKTITGVDELEIGTGDDRIKLKKSSRGTIDFVDRNNKSIGGIGTEARINTTGVITATTFAGALSGTATNATRLDNRISDYYLNYNNFTSTPTIPTNTNQLTNGAGFITTAPTNTNQLTNGAGFITAAGTLTNGNQTNITSIGTLTSLEVNGNVSIGGVLTYEDVKNVDSVGIVTARRGIVVGAGHGIHVASGVITATTFDGNLVTSNLTGTITNAQLAGSISNDKLAGSIADSKLASTFLKNVLEDTTPQLGGNLDINGKYITGTGGVNITGVTTIGNVVVGGATTDLIVEGNARVTGILSVGTGTVVIDETTVKTGTSNLHSVGIEIAGINVLGADTPIGTGATIYDEGGAGFTGVVTATTFDGNLAASNLTGTIDVARLGSGASGTKFLRGDNTWQTVSSGGISNIGIQSAGTLVGSATTINFTAGNITVANNIANVSVGSSIRFVGARMYQNDYSVTVSGSWTSMGNYDGTTLDTNSFANTTTGRFTIPAGVSKVKLSTNVRAVANGNNSNQWMIAKNNTLIDTTAGGFNIDLDGTSGYDNPGAFGQTAVIEVVEGDYFALAYYVANTDIDVDAWYQIEVIEGSLLGHYFASTNVTNADNITVQANNSTDETVYPIFVDGATGAQGPESDTGLTYNPSSGNLTATQLTGTLLTAAQTNITSVGTIGAGTWQGTAVADSYVASAATWNAKIANVLEDTTPQLGGNLDANSKSIYGVGILTATQIADGNSQVGAAGSVLSSTGSGLSWVAQSGGGGGGSQNVFSTIAVSGQNNVVADATTDTLTLVAGTNVTITTDDSADSVTINASGGGGGSSGPDSVIMGMIF